MNMDEIKKRNKRKIKRLKEINQQKGFIEASRSLYRYILRFRKYPRSLKNYYYNWLKYKKSNSYTDPYKIIYINPEKIKYILYPRFGTHYLDRYSYIIPGQWDVNETKASSLQVKKTASKDNRKLAPIQKHVVYQSFKEHFIDGKSWEKTKYYKIWIEKVKNTPKSHSNYGTKEKFLNRFEEYDRLFHEIKTKGYKTQEELRTGNSDNNYPLTDFNVAPQTGEILVNIGRDGKFILDDGRHRLFIVKLLGLEEVPVRIFVRHKKWQELRERYKDMDFNERKQIIKHPDMNDIKKDFENG
ncbi:hypothetical protein [Methanonatronarchaeum sp. AMET-Sl]|uniref:hypothetical protein n=1 Tax=Methanonatronarchaeum sp. AMET-Sl TaxID=3037654 RepID=UPI00244E4D56|nr:hypothetical protein [Methanonatronarchaeum sp. AMET-Sl]WGI17659.1 hypothetical protein QEN48_01225 [Methanonatronarchaeum sp. AMET-Sl]